MARRAWAVIGANWGDEGKGLAVDTLAAELRRGGREVVVVRSNGGAQAGHGVMRPDGRFHVFHHVGAGSFAGADTHLSRHFVAHPMMLREEWQALSGLGLRTFSMSIDPRAPVTTPWDMAINQVLEQTRAGRRHGSTGLGFGETIEREENGPRLMAAYLWSKDLRDRLEAIRDGWVPKRLARLGIDPEQTALADVLTGRADIITPFLQDCAWFTRHVAPRMDAHLAEKDAILFEGAQGLQLDMEFGVFPHVTRSFTGLRNMLSIAADAEVEAIAPLYMTRAYATRHGAGPLPSETPRNAGEISWARVVDRTNAPNPWQGAIRQAPLDLDLMASVVARDLARADGSGIAIDPGLGLTCLDQIQDMAQVVRKGSVLEVRRERLADLVSETVGLPLRLLSRGPVREAVEHLGMAEETKAA